MTLDPTKWREIPGKPCYFEYIGPQREPDLKKIRTWINEAVGKSRNVAGNTRRKSQCDVDVSDSQSPSFPRQEISSASKTSNSIADHRVETCELADLGKVDLL